MTPLRGGEPVAVTDAEDAWFVRVNHIAHYGTDPDLEEITVHPKEPLLFLNIRAVPGGTAGGIVYGSVVLRKSTGNSDGGVNMLCSKLGACCWCWGGWWGCC